MRYYMVKILCADCGHSHVGFVESIRTPDNHERIHIQSMPAMESLPGFSGRKWIEDLLQEHLDYANPGSKAQIWDVSGTDGAHSQPIDTPCWSQYPTED